MQIYLSTTFHEKAELADVLDMISTLDLDGRTRFYTISIWRTLKQWSSTIRILVTIQFLPASADKISKVIRSNRWGYLASFKLRKGMPIVAASLGAHVYTIILVSWQTKNC